MTLEWTDITDADIVRALEDACEVNGGWATAQAVCEEMHLVEVFDGDPAPHETGVHLPSRSMAKRLHGMHGRGLVEFQTLPCGHRPVPGRWRPTKRKDKDG